MLIEYKLSLKRESDRANLKSHVADIRHTKNEPHIRITVAFQGSGWDKISGKNGLDLMAFGGLLVRCKSAVFW